MEVSIEYLGGKKWKIFFKKERKNKFIVGTWK